MSCNLYKALYCTVSRWGVLVRLRLELSLKVIQTRFVRFVVNDRSVCLIIRIFCGSFIEKMLNCSVNPPYLLLGVTCVNLINYTQTRSGTVHGFYC